MSEASGASPCVHVLLASYQGARYIREQLASIACQTHTNWTLTVSDDGHAAGLRVTGCSDARDFACAAALQGMSASSAGW